MQAGSRSIEDPNFEEVGSNAVVPTGGELGNEAKVPVVVPNFLGFLPITVISLIASYLDRMDLENLSLVSKAVNKVLDKGLVWRTKLEEEFNISPVISKLFRVPRLVFQRLKKLSTNTSAEMSTIYDQMRYQIIDPCVSPYSHPWLFYPYVDRNAFKAQLKKDGRIFQEYYLELACLVGNDDFVFFMMNYGDYELSERHFKLACLSGNGILIQYFIDELGFEPNSEMLRAAMSSRRLNVVKLLIEDYSLKPDQNDLCAAALSGGCEVVQYLHDKTDLEFNDEVLRSACQSGKVDVIRFFTAEQIKARFSDINEIVSYSLELLVFLIEEVEIIVEEKYRVWAFRFGLSDVDDYLRKKDVNISEGNRKLSCSSGNLAFVKAVIKEYGIKPNKEWLVLAIGSGNLALARYLVDTYQLSLREDDFPDIVDEDYGFGSLGMFKFIVEELGLRYCYNLRECLKEFQSMNNLHVVRYAVNEGAALPFQREFDDDYLLQFSHNFNDLKDDQNFFNKYVAWVVRQGKSDCLNYSERLANEFLDVHASNSLLRGLGVRNNYRFSYLVPNLSSISFDGNHLTAMCLLLRERIKSHSYVEICAPHFQDRDNLQGVLRSCKQFIQGKSQKTKEIFIPFSTVDGRWHLLHLDFVENVAIAISSRDLLFCRKDDPGREKEEEWDYSDRQSFEQFSKAQVIDKYYRNIFDSVDAVFGREMRRKYKTRFVYFGSGSPALLALLNLMWQLKIFSIDTYGDSLGWHPFPQEGIYCIDLHHTVYEDLKRQALGYLSLNLDRLSRLDAVQLVNEGGRRQRLVSELRPMFYEKDNVTPKLIHAQKIEGVSASDKDNFRFIKEAFLQTYEFDGYNSITHSFTPAFSGANEGDLYFPPAYLSWVMALLIFLGFPSRPERKSFEEGAVLSWRQVIRNFFGGWNPIHYDKKTGKTNIQAKVLLNIFLLPFKVLLLSAKVVLIPFKIAVNIIKLFVEFLPLLVLKYIAYYLLYFRKLLEANFHGMSKAFRILSLTGNVLLFITSAFLYSLTVCFYYMFLPIFSPEKSVRVAWATAMKQYQDVKILGVIAGVFWVVMSLILSGVIWGMVGFGLGTIIPQLIAAIPHLASLVSTIISLPVISTILSFAQGALASLLTLVPAVYSQAVYVVLIAVSVVLSIFGVALVDGLSNDWARWKGPKVEWKHDPEEYELERSLNVLEMLDKKDALESKAQRVDEHAEKMLERFSDDSGPETLLGTEAGLTTDPELSAFFPNPV